MKGWQSALFAPLILLASVAQADTAPTPPEPANKPDWKAVREKSEAMLKEDLFDPQSAIIHWTKGFSWYSVKPIQFFAKKKWGWVGCVAVNAKNRYGGYVGDDIYTIVVAPDGQITIPHYSDIMSKCDLSSDATPLQTELLAEMDAKSSPSVADQLEKLSGLLDRGLITRAEFDAQKAKLIGITP